MKAEDQLQMTEYLLLLYGSPVKDEEIVGDDWRDFDWPHSESGCPGWSVTDQSGFDLREFEDFWLVTLTHCRCACRVYPLVTIGLEFQR